MSGEGSVGCNRARVYMLYFLSRSLQDALREDLKVPFLDPTPFWFDYQKQTDPGTALPSEGITQLWQAHFWTQMFSAEPDRRPHELIYSDLFE